MPEEDLVDIKFRLYDGSDIGPFRYSSASTIEMLKERIVSEWPKGLSSINCPAFSHNYLLLCFLNVEMVHLIQITRIFGVFLL